MLKCNFSVTSGWFYSRNMMITIFQHLSISDLPWHWRQICPTTCRSSGLSTARVIWVVQVQVQLCFLGHIFRTKGHIFYKLIFYFKQNIKNAVEKQMLLSWYTKFHIPPLDIFSHQQAFFSQGQNRRGGGHGGLPHGGGWVLQQKRWCLKRLGKIKPKKKGWKKGWKKWYGSKDIWISCEFHMNIWEFLIIPDHWALLPFCDRDCERSTMIWVLFGFLLSTYNISIFVHITSRSISISISTEFSQSQYYVCCFWFWPSKRTFWPKKDQVTNNGWGPQRQRRCQGGSIVRPKDWQNTQHTKKSG